MDPRTLDLFRCLQSGPHDEAGLQRIQRLLSNQRRMLRSAGDFAGLRELVELLEVWANAAENSQLSAAALGEAAEIAESELRQLNWAEQLRTRALSVGRTRVELDDAPTAVRPSHPRVAPVRADTLSEDITRIEQALESEATPVLVKRLADLYAQRRADGDDEQAADLYCTLADVLGPEVGRSLVDRALELAPEHRDAHALRRRFDDAQAPLLLDADVLLEKPAPRKRKTTDPYEGAPPPLPAAALVASSLSPIAVPVPKIPVKLTSARRSRSARVLPWFALGGVGLSAAAAFALWSQRPLSPPSAAALPAPSTVLVMPPPSVALPGAAPAVAPKAETPPPVEMAKPAAEPEAPVVPPAPAPGPMPQVKAVMKQVSLRGGTFQANGFNTTLDTLYPQFAQCYATALESKRRLKGDLVLGFTVKTSGRVVSAKSLGGSISDAKLTRCSLEVVQKTRFPKPRKQAAKVKLPLQYRLVSAVQ